MGFAHIGPLLLAMATAAACAAEPDPLKSEACKAALAELEQVVGEPASDSRARRVAQAREQAATACLGRSQGRGVRSGAPYPAQSVAPPVATVPRPSPALRPVAPPPAAEPAPRAAVITSCDPAGCWDSNGQRLNRMGPLLMGPRGACTAQGGLVNCP
jgi:hypothetical protein